MRYAHYDHDIPELEAGRDPGHIDHPDGEQLPPELIPPPTEGGEQ
ncbi:hypothetical protein [Phytoactinopolyspora limicola]|nr:hypothetical protein [Phytoactinopolyspora limicola]